MIRSQLEPWYHWYTKANHGSARTLYLQECPPTNVHLSKFESIRMRVMCDPCASRQVRVLLYTSWMLKKIATARTSFKQSRKKGSLLGLG